MPPSAADPFADPSAAANDMPADHPRTREKSGGDPGAPTRTKMSRSTTAGTSSAQPAQPQQSSRSRSHSVSGSDPSKEKPRASAAPAKSSSKGKAKKPSHHVDVIDMLDYSGLGGGRFHHDGPFDAAAPSRNRSKTKAPMLAFPDEGDMRHPTSRSQDRHLTPLAQATRAAMAQSPGSGYPSFPMTDSYMDDRNRKPQKKNTLAEAWGMADPEPFEDFFGGSPAVATSYHTESGNASANSSIRGERERERERSRKDNRGRDAEPPQRVRTQLPPPQPIALPGASTSPTSPSFDPDSYPIPNPATRPAGPKRSRSLIQRIRKMRDNPNVPLNTPGGIEEGDENEGAYFSEGHASTTGPARQYASHNGKPRLPPVRQGGSGLGSPDFVVVEAEGPTPPAKDTPGGKYNTRHSPEDEEYFDRLPALGAGQGILQQPVSPGMGRKQSILKKVKGVVGGIGR